MCDVAVDTWEWSARSGLAILKSVTAALWKCVLLCVLNVGGSGFWEND